MGKTTVKGSASQRGHLAKPGPGGTGRPSTNRPPSQADQLHRKCNCAWSNRRPRPTPTRGRRSTLYTRNHPARPGAALQVHPHGDAQTRLEQLGQTPRSSTLAFRQYGGGAQKYEEEFLRLTVADARDLVTALDFLIATASRDD